MKSVKIIQYRWAGKWGPFKIKIECGECTLSEGIIKDVIKEDFKGETIEFETKDWLPNWWRLILKGGWHAPIITVNGKVVFQGAVIDRGFLASKIRGELVEGYEPEENTVFFKEGCKHCIRAKELLDSRKIGYEKMNVVDDPLAARRMFYAVKKYVPRNQPVTVPQIWLDGKYVGGSNDLTKYLT